MTTMSTGGMRLMHSPMAAADPTSSANANNNDLSSTTAFGFANRHHSSSSSSSSNNCSVVVHDGIGNNNNGGNGGNNNGVNSNAPLLLRFTTTDATVDYDVNVTPLYGHIGDSNWTAATERCWKCPGEASTWVVKYRRDGSGNRTTSSSSTVGGGSGDNASSNGDVLWRFLPIHSACALNPPASFVRALLQCHPRGTRTLDDQGMLPLHYACGARCTREVLYLLLMSFPQAALRADPNGMLPLHYLAQWGPSEPGVIDMVCVATGHKMGGTCFDGDGNTAEMLADNAAYDGHELVAAKIRDYGNRMMHRGNVASISSSPAASPSGGGGGASEVLSLTPSLIAINNALEGAGTCAPMSPMSASSSYRNRVGDRKLSIQTAFSPQNSRQHQRHNSAPTDKYSSFEDDGAEDNGIIGTKDNRIVVVNNKNNNENDSNSWNMTTPRSGRRVMNKLGMSPTHNYLQAGGDDGGNRYLSPNYSFSLDLSANYGKRDPTPDPTATGVASRELKSRHSPRNNTRSDPPAETGSFATRRSSSTPRSFGPIAVNYAGSSPSTTNVVRTSTVAAASATPNADRIFDNSPGVNIDIPSNTSATNNSSRNTAYIPQYGSYSSSHSTTIGLPPKSPRVPQSPRSFNTKDGAGVGVKGGNQYPSGHVQHQESREPISDTDRQDRRLAELREELSSIRASGGGGFANNVDGRQHSRNLTTASVRFSENESREPPPRSIETNTFGGGSFVANSSVYSGQSGSMQDENDAREPPLQGNETSTVSGVSLVANSSMYSGQAGSMLDSSNSTMRKLTHLTQQLHLLNEAGNQPNNDENERNAAIHASQREKALMKEIDTLRAEKESAEAALKNIATIDDNVSKTGKVDRIDDEVSHNASHSQLTSQNNFDNEGVETIGSPRMKMGRCADVTTNSIVVGVDSSVTSSKGFIQNDVERLMKEKAEIELAIQQAIIIQRDKELSELSNASDASIEESKDILEEALNLKKIAELTEQILREQKRSTELEQQVSHLKDEKEMINRSHTESVNDHLKEVQSLRECFDKAKIEIDKYRDNARDALETKEQEWNEERRTLVEKIENHKVKCAMAQSEIEEYREDAKSLREGFEKAKIDIDKYRDDAQRALTTKESEWNEERRVLKEQIKNLEEKLCLAQNDEQKVRALAEENELKWKEERRCLEMEKKVLKDSVGTDSHSDAMVRLRMQLANAIAEAEDMRNFNSVIRREHDKTVEALELDLKEERKSKTESLSQIVTLQYKIASLQEDAKEHRMLEPMPSSESRGSVSFASCSKEDDTDYSRERHVRLEPTPSSRSRGSVSFGSSSSRGSNNNFEECRILEMEVHKLKEKLREKVDEVQQCRRELDATKKLVEEMEYLPCQSSHSIDNDKSEKYLEQICDLKKKISQLKQNEVVQAQQLREESKLHEHALLDKEDEYNEKIRELENKHELELIQRKDISRAELQEQEAKYLKQISDLERKQKQLLLDADPYSAREIDKIVKQKDENNEKRIKKIISEADEDFNRRAKEMIATKEREYENKVAELEDAITALKDIIKKKDNEFEVTVSGLEDEIATLRRKFDAKLFDAERHEKEQHEKELRECKRELDRQRRNHRSEMNKLNNTLEMQKSKQERLQSHIASLEKQISDMVNDYEEKLMRAYYDKR